MNLNTSVIRQAAKLYHFVWRSINTYFSLQPLAISLNLLRGIEAAYTPPEFKPYEC